MSLRTQPRRPVCNALWLGGLLVVLGGLFGMHGLDSHGGAGMNTMAHTAMTAPTHGAASSPASMSGTVHGAAAAAAAVTAEAVVGATSGAPGHSGISMGAAGMCMAVLVLSLLLLILRLYASRVPPLLWLVARSVRSPLVRGRDPDPPSLFRLSIQRC